MSAAGADGVIRPTETKSTPLAAIAAMVSSRTPPEASVGARPATSTTASRSTGGGMLSSSSRAPPAAGPGPVGGGPAAFAESRAAPGGARPPHRLADPAGDQDMIVLDH